MVSQGSAYFAIWWAWRNFTWFASADDTDDVPYRLLTLLQIGGVLMAAGVADGFGRQDFTVVTVGYVLMRVAMVTQWLRMAHDHPAGRRTALRYAAGIATLQLGWIALLALPLSWRGAGFLLLAAGELAVPVWSAVRPAHRLAPRPHRRTLRPVHPLPGRGRGRAPGRRRDRRPPRQPGGPGRFADPGRAGRAVSGRPGAAAQLGLPLISSARRGVEPECLHDRPPTNRLGIIVKGGRPGRQRS